MRKLLNPNGHIIILNEEIGKLLKVNGKLSWEIKQDLLNDMDADKALAPHIKQQVLNTVDYD